jgi:perosamine synthetase
MVHHSRPWITESDITAVQQVLSREMLAQGSITHEFEKALADYFNVDDAIACSSGTAALSLALRALNIGSGDEVILPTYVCHSVADAIRGVGAQPVFCDIGEHWVITTENVIPFLSVKTKAIIVVHIFGIVADTLSFKKFGLPIIEDCCQAFGARLGGFTTGFMGTCGIFSFQGTKCLTTGEGGAVMSADSDFLRRIKKIDTNPALRFPMSDMQAALGLNQLKRYAEFLDHRFYLADRYFNELPNHVIQEMIAVKDHSMFFRFLLRQKTQKSFNEIRDWFAEQRIAVRQGVDQLIHRYAGMSDEYFPIAKQCFEETISIPIYPALTYEQQSQIIYEIRKWLTRCI